MSHQRDKEDDKPFGPYVASEILNPDYGGPLELEGLTLKCKEIIG